MNLAMPASIFMIFFEMPLVELAAAFHTLRMNKGDRRLVPWLIQQRFVYQQLRYYVILKSIVSAIRVGKVGWANWSELGRRKSRLEDGAIAVKSYGGREPSSFE